MYLFHFTSFCFILFYLFIFYLNHWSNGQEYFLDLILFSFKKSKKKSPGENFNLHEVQKSLNLFFTSEIVNFMIL